MENFFRTCFNVKAIKAKYRELAKQFHPDLGGCEETMKAVNDQYHNALSGKHESTYKDAEGETRTYYYNAKREQAVVDKLREILGKRLPEDVKIELLGTWIWVSGNTKPIKKILGKGTEDEPGCKMRWHGKRSMWYWRPASKRATFYSGASMDTLRAAYGSETNFKADEQIS